ncbi:MAG: DNA polymerase III subunit chi [Alphaproteobacteria bacterium]|nr:DNA polymerase III subunit chi [Alphaproteobacteria bacterium]
MSRVDFYHLQKQTLEEVLPKLLLKAYSTEKHIVVKIGTPERVDFINTELWTFSDDSFLPHGSKKDGFAAQQPIWLTDEDDNPNEAAFLFLVDGAETDAAKAAEYERVFNIFDGNSGEALAQARNLWKKFRDAGNEVYYWQQTEKGVWEQKA